VALVRHLLIMVETEEQVFAQPLRAQEFFMLVVVVVV
jgi:hypothetical protein